MSRQTLALGNIRFADPDDAPNVMKLLNEAMSKTFRISEVEDVIYLIENSIMSICHFDMSHKLVGFLSVKDYPMIPSIHPSCWEEYIWTKYKAVELKARNTLFLHLLAWDRAFGRDVVDSMLKSLFMHDPYVHHIVMIKTLPKYPLLVPGQSRAEASFRRVQVLEKGVSGDSLPALCVADRPEVSPRLRIRRAVEEDNDDIIPILERHTPKLQEMYGEFYISELIARHPESERVLLVCEHKELAVGVMCLNSQINYEALEEAYVLSPYSGLRHIETAHKKQADYFDSGYNLIDGMQSHLNLIESMHNSVYHIDSNGKGKVFYTESNPDDDISAVRDPSVSSPPPHLDYLNLLEDDELDFDIINIDTDLLQMPRMLSYDDMPFDEWKLPNRKPRESLFEESTIKIKKQATSIMPIVMPNLIRYSGKPNAFLLELFAMHPDYDERYGFDMLEVAFELFPDREYCVLSLPSNHAAFPLLEHFSLVTPFSTKLRFLNETLYVAHVNSVRGSISARTGEMCDLSAVDDVLEHSPRRQRLLELFESSVYSRTLRPFVLMAENQIVGVVMVGPLQDGTLIRTQFDLNPEPLRAGTDGAILGGIISPAFEPHARWFIREIIRRSKFTALFWVCRLLAKGDAGPGRNLISVASHMKPIRPRRIMPLLTGNKNLEEVFVNGTKPFALWGIDRPMTSLPKVDINNSIVVVGASRTGLAFLEALFMGPSSQYVSFSNLCLVSEHGLPTVAECLRAADSAVPKDGRYTDKYLKSIPFYYYLDVITSVMTGIDRRRKCIKLKSGGVKYYDTLVLTCGKQFQHPHYLKHSLERVRELDKGTPCERILMDNPEYRPDKVELPSDLPDNVMLINSLYEANICMRKLWRIISDSKEEKDRLTPEHCVIVYGSCPEAYSCVAGLLELGLSPELLTLVDTHPLDQGLRVNCFNDETVDMRVMDSMKNIGVRVVYDSKMTSWHVRDGRLHSIRLLSHMRMFKMECFALFYYGTKAIDINAFKAINECGLVYDGGVVVGSEFETNDPSVFAAGGVTAHSRRLRAHSTHHHYYRAEDIGEALASIFLKKLDPFVQDRKEPRSAVSELMATYSSATLGSHTSIGRNISNFSKIFSKNSRRWEPVPRFESPLVLWATLPGPLHYLRLNRPGPLLPMEVAMALPHQGHTLITEKNGNYFRLQLNEFHCIEAITCLSSEPFQAEIFAQLYGKHESFFDNLLTRYQMNLIEDFYEYFTQPWLVALYQETFFDLLNDINLQEIGTVYDLARSRDATAPPSLVTSPADSDPSREEPEQTEDYYPLLGMGPEDAPKLGTFRDILDKYVKQKSTHMMTHMNIPLDIPSECGQCSFIRGEASAFWKTVKGDDIVMRHLTKHLRKHSVTNAQYAAIDPTK